MTYLYKIYKQGIYNIPIYMGTNQASGWHCWEREYFNLWKEYEDDFSNAKMFRISPKCAIMLHTIYVYYAGTYGIFQKR